jgi:hypothetical protein
MVMSEDYRELCAELADELWRWLDDRSCEETELLDRARAALAAKPQPATMPIPLSERKPRPEDGYCLSGHPDSSIWVWVGCIDRIRLKAKRETEWKGEEVIGVWHWELRNVDKGLQSHYTHWLPASTRFLPARVEG